MLKICASLKFQHVRSIYRKMVGILLFRWNYACAQTATRPHDVIKISGYFPKPQGASNTLRPCTSGVSTQHSEHSRTIGIIPGLARDFKAEHGFYCACISSGVELSKTRHRHMFPMEAPGGDAFPALRGFISVYPKLPVIPSTIF